MTGKSAVDACRVVSGSGWNFGYGDGTWGRDAVRRVEIRKKGTAEERGIGRLGGELGSIGSCVDRVESEYLDVQYRCRVPVAIS